jgi:hypothetical protein
MPGRTSPDLSGEALERQLLPRRFQAIRKRWDGVVEKEKPEEDALAGEPSSSQRATGNR